MVHMLWEMCTASKLLLLVLSPMPPVPFVRPASQQHSLYLRLSCASRGVPALCTVPSHALQSYLTVHGS